jgi:hypothetical protein
MSRMPRLLAVLAVLVLIGSVSLAATRTWKSSNGQFSIKAELLDYKDGKAQLKKSDGTIIDVPLASLCEADRQYVKNQFPGAEEERLAPGAEYRTWKAKKGSFSTTAALVSCANGKVQLRKPDGTELTVDKSALSPADQRWIAAELKRQGEDDEADKSDKVADKNGSEEAVGQIDEQEIPMKVTRLDLPKGKGRTQAVSLATFLLSQTSPQQIYVKQGDSSKEEAFHRVVSKEPTYNAPTPIRGVAKFASHEYGFAFDSANGKATGPNRLYFDINGNGDLTDDKPIAATMASNPIPGFSQSQFPRVDITIETGGKSIEYAFVPSVVCRASNNEAYATVTFYAAAVREGRITRGGKHTTFMLVDHNSNGLYDDAVSVTPDGNMSEGDLLLVNPKAKRRTSSELELGRDCSFVNKVVGVSGQFYRLETQPSGESLKLTPTQLSMGYVSNSSPLYRAVVFCKDYGVVGIAGTKDQKIALPEGSWKVINYTIEAGGAKTSMAARFDANSKATNVAKGETAQLPFGPPLHAAVTAIRAGGDKIYLSLSIVGQGGERCTSLTVNGNRPPKPLFKITDKDGKLVHQGCFEWG